MSESTGVAHPNRWVLGAGTLLVFLGCGGTVIERKDGGSGAAGSGAGTSEDGGSTGTGGRAGGTGGGKAGRPSTGGKVGSGGRVGTGGAVASGGTTSGAGGSRACPPPYTECPDGCIDIQSSSSHCGSCFGACPSNTTCIDGVCQGKMQTCAAGTEFCSNFGECLDTKSNPFACGSCFTGCPGTRCNNGVCDPKSCISPTATYCASSSRCVETANDYQNCGGCDKPCGPADSCQNGKCVPPDCGGGGITYCKNSGCTDISTDPFNCGGCEKTCAGGGAFDGTAYACNAGKCSCSFIANKCGKGCTSAFWYCPPDGFTGDAAALCTQTARNGYESCACKGCLAEVQACFGSTSCMNSMDCTLPNPCPNCFPTFSSCTDQNGDIDPIAEKLVQCMNAKCSKP